MASGASPSAGIVFGLDDPRHPGLGRRCAKLVVPATAKTEWRGWQQKVPVRPGHTYLVAAEVKCQDVRTGAVQVHAHRLQADGQLCKQEPMVGCGPPISGTTGWTLMSNLFTMPQDAATLQLHLTMDQPGTVWHDSVLVAEVIPGTILGLEQRPGPDSDELNVWPIPAVVKVFPDDCPPHPVPPAKISVARNEREPLQLAVRSPKSLGGVRVEIDPPVGPQGNTLTDLSVGVVGYVPIDHPTSYYQSQTPAWHRKYPRGGGQSDGWAGLWPDPLVPRPHFDLRPDMTQPIWITVSVGSQVPAGDYHGSVRLVGDNGKPVAAVPFSVHVWNFTLPEQSHVKAIYDVSLGDGERYWAQTTAQARPEIIKFMARNRTSPDRIQPSPVFTYRNGKASADFRAFDQAAHQYFDEWKLPHSYMPDLFYLFGWGFPPKDFFGEHPYPGEPPFETADRSRLRPEYKQTYQACLKLFWDHVK